MPSHLVSAMTCFLLESGQQLIEESKKSKLGSVRLETCSQADKVHLLRISTLMLWD